MKLSLVVKEVLNILEAGVVISVGAFRQGSLNQKSAWINRMLNELEFEHDDKKVKRALNRLYLAREVERIGKGDTITIQLTEKGRKKLLNYKIYCMRLILPKAWDHVWRVVIFDVPEKYKTTRDTLRRVYLKKMGFVQIQDSVFVTPYACRDEIDFIAEFYDIRPYLRIIEATSIDGDDELKKHFKL